jgi:hypothetical protein
MVVAVGLTAGSRAAFAMPIPPSPLAQAGINQINAVANSFEVWADTVCPIFAGIVADAYDISPELGQIYAETYTSVVCDVARSDIAAINSIARTYSSLVTSSTDKGAIEAARLAAIDRILVRKAACIAEIWGVPAT